MFNLVFKFRNITKFFGENSTMKTYGDTLINMLREIESNLELNSSSYEKNVNNVNQQVDEIKRLKWI